MPNLHTRRRVLARLSGIAAAALLPIPHLSPAVVEAGRLEISSVRLTRFGGLCLSPQYVAEELLRAEGFDDVVYVDIDKRRTSLTAAVAAGDADFTLDFAPHVIQAINAGGRVAVLAGVHSGCFELFAQHSIHRIADLRGKSVGVNLLGLQDTFLTAIAANVGLDPAKDIRWVTEPSPDPLELFAEGKIEAFLGTAPEPQVLRARNVGHVLFNSNTDRPWSQYFCCMLSGNADYVRRYPAASKRVLRAIIKATDLCATDPAGVARRLVDRGFGKNYDEALQTVSELSYDKWRDYDPEDTLRFYTLRLREAGLIKAAPQQIIAENTDWRFLDELKRELKT
jgi:NitT/TauT family transport system substrate-binding protein